MGKSRQREHQFFLDWLIEQSVNEQIDALIVAGDIFDTGAPPSYARELYHKFVISFSEATNNQVPLVIVAGNHDSVAMLDETATLLKRFNTHVTSCADTTNMAQHLIPVSDSEGHVKGIIGCVPFLRARDIVSSTSGTSGKEKQQDLQLAIKMHYEQLYEEALALRGELEVDVPIIMTGHLTVVGAQTSESVRDIYIGTLEAFSASLFPPADYIALGHIHKQQAINSNNAVHYCGSPIPLSFDELKQSKSVQLVTLRPESVEVDLLNIPVFQAMYKIKGNMTHISNEIQLLKEQYALESEPKESESAWLEIVVEEQDYLEDLQTRIEELLGDSCLEVLCLKRSRKRKELSLALEDAERLQELSAEQVFDKRMSLEGGGVDEALRERLRVKFKEALHCVEHGESL